MAVTTRAQEQQRAMDAVMTARGLIRQTNTRIHAFTQRAKSFSDSITKGNRNNTVLVSFLTAQQIVDQNKAASKALDMISDSYSEILTLDMARFDEDLGRNMEEINAALDACKANFTQMQTSLSDFLVTFAKTQNTVRTENGLPIIEDA